MRSRDIKLHLRLSVAAVALLAATLIGAEIRAQTPGPLPGPNGTFGPPTFTANGHFGLGNGSPPTVSACGTSPGAVSGTDAAFHFVTGSSASGACSITPAKGYALRPTCTVDTESATKPGYTVAVNGVMVLSTVQDSTRYYVHCIAQPGGL